MKLFIELSYLGTDFCGYQVQPVGRTVQGELTKAAKALFGIDCDITGCSRTDAGVHANTFCATVTYKGTNNLETSLPPDRIPMALNAHLPEDISVKNAAFVSEDFHPRYDVKSKEYLYLIQNSKVQDPFLYGRTWFLPRIIFENGIKLMNDAANFVVGTHDFSAFMSEGSDVEDTVRNITSLVVERSGDLIEIRICADGFLYNMVRIIVGTLTEVAFGRISPDDIPDIIESHNRARAGMTAPAEGLYLNKVIY